MKLRNIKNVKILLSLLIVCIGGCVRYPVYEAPPHTYYLNPQKDVTKIGRVALIELANNSDIPQIDRNVTESLYQEIQKKQIFGVTKISQNDPAWRGLQLGIDTNYTYDQVAQIQNVLKCDAILTGTITDFEAYPHMTIGLRLRLIDLSDSQLIWAMEQVWDTTDKKTQERIESYYNPRLIMLNDENLSGQLGSVSSLKFFKFVANEITETLEPD